MRLDSPAMSNVVFHLPLHISAGRFCGGERDRARQRSPPSSIHRVLAHRRSRDRFNGMSHVRSLAVGTLVGLLRHQDVVPARVV
jgi:hypothetical protein